METNIKKGQEYRYFSQDTVNRLLSTVRNEIIEHQKTSNSSKKNLFGSFISDEIPLLKGGKTSAYIEYDAIIYDSGVVDCGINRCVLFDTLPDWIMDRHNELKEIAKNSSK